MRAPISICACLASTLMITLLVTSKGAEPQTIRDIIKRATKTAEQIPDLNSFLEEKPAITTSLKDAVTEAPFLDDFSPKDTSLMTWLPRGSGGSFKLTRTGVFKFRSQSYCLHAGTYGPDRGEGYVYAPIMGPRAAVIKAILQRTWNRPEIDQDNIQTLIWAVLARIRINDMSDENLDLALSILTKSEIAELNGGALGEVPDEVLDNAKSRLPAAIHQVIEAEAQLRNLLTVPGTTYSELERVAVLTGEHERGKDSRDIPDGRWSYHPDGFFIRYFPHGYRTTEIELSVPGAFTIRRDNRRRIILVDDRHGHAMEFTYNDETSPLSASGDSNVSGFTFKSVRYRYRAKGHPERGLYQVMEWTGQGWALLGLPNGKGEFRASSARYADAKRRYESSRNHQKELENLINQAVKAGGKNAKRGSDTHKTDALDLAGLCFAMREIGGAKNNDVMRISPVELLQRAWQRSVALAAGAPQSGRYGAGMALPGMNREKSARIASAYHENGLLHGLAGPAFAFAAFPSNGMPAVIPAQKEGNNDGDGGDDGGEFDPCDGVASPGNTASQRLKPSQREEEDSDKDPAPCEKGLEALKNALRWAAAYSDPDVLKNSSDARDYNKNVENKAMENFRQETGGEPEVSVDASVGTDCQLYIGDHVATFDEFRKWMSDAYAGYPPDVIEAWVQHERKHMEQCYKDDDFGTETDSKEDLSKAEIEAYCTESQIMMDYLNSECGGVPPDLQQKFDSLCRK